MAFENSIDGMTLADLMKATGLYHSTILRLCESLEHFRYLKRLPDGRYMLGPMPFYLGMVYQGLVPAAGLRAAGAARADQGRPTRRRRSMCAKAIDGSACTGSSCRAACA